MFDLYMRDIYPDMGTVEISTAVQPDEADLITEQDDQSAAQHASNSTKAGASRGKLFMAFVLLVILAVIMGVVE